MARRLAAGLVAAVLLVPAVTIPVHATTVERLVSWYGGGSIVLQDVGSDQATITELGFSLDSPEGTTAEVYVLQDVYPILPDGTWGDLSTERVADVLHAPVNIDLTRLTSASLSIGGDGSTWQSCDAQTWTCVDEPFSLDASWTSAGPLLHDHQTTNELQVGLTRFGADSLGAYRYQTATATLNGQPIAGASPDGILPLLFRQTQGITTLVFGTPLATAASSTPVSLHANLSGLQAIANMTQQTASGFVDTGVIASTHAVLPDGSTMDNAVLFDSVTQYIDDQGNFGDMVDVTGIATGQVSIDRTLGSATASATIPVSVCIYPADFNLPPTCTNGSVDVTGTWAATDKTAHSLLVGTTMVSGTWVYNVRQITQSRDANAQVTVDGVDAGTSTASSLVSELQGVNSVQPSTR